MPWPARWPRSAGLAAGGRSCASPCPPPTLRWRRCSAWASASVTSRRSWLQLPTQLLVLVKGVVGDVVHLAGVIAVPGGGRLADVLERLGENVQHLVLDVVLFSITGGALPLGAKVLVLIEGRGGLLVGLVD